MQITNKPSLFISLWSIIDGGHPMASYEALGDRIHLDVMEVGYCGSDLFLDFRPDDILGDSRLKLDVHLMMREPETWINNCTYHNRLASVSVHLDNRRSLDNSLSTLCALGLEAGIVAKLDDDWQLVAEYAPQCDQVVVMGTPIGVKGVSLQPEALETIRRLVRLRAETNAQFRILADGGIRENTVLELVHAGADALAIGSLLCNAPQPLRDFWRNLEAGLAKGS